jgi:putative ABC transport system ATP-binding protein
VKDLPSAMRFFSAPRDPVCRQPSAADLVKGKENLVQVRGLTRRHRVGSTEVWALGGIDLDIHQGEFLAVVGVSGSGKSTLLHLIGGLDTPTGGSIIVNGQELAALRSYERALYRRQTVGFVFQAFHLVPTLTAEANVSLALTLKGIYGEERRIRTRDALARVGLTHRAGHRPGQLSGGEQQRVALARALAHCPPLLLADEPTGNLDRSTAEEVIGCLRRLGPAQGPTVVLVTHDEETAGRVADRVVRLRDGRLVQAEGVG